MALAAQQHFAVACIHTACAMLFRLSCIRPACRIATGRQPAMPGTLAATPQSASDFYRWLGELEAARSSETEEKFRKWVLWVLS